MQALFKFIFKHKDIIKNAALYLRRHYLTPRRMWPFRIFLHLINQPDSDRDPHNHPWGFFTVILWGGYWEAIYKTDEQIRGLANPTMKHWGMFSFGWRPASHVHQVVSLSKPTWTLVFAAPASRGWGFWLPSGEFVPEAKYLGREDAPVAEEDRI